MRDEAIRRGVTIRVILDHHLPRIVADPIQIQQVLLNLAANAMDAMMMVPSPELTVRSERYSADEIAVSIDDNGPGISPEVASKIFEPFFSTVELGGTGMGAIDLSCSDGEAHDGRIYAEKLDPSAWHARFTLRVCYDERGGIHFVDDDAAICEGLSNLLDSVVSLPSGVFGQEAFWCWNTVQAGRCLSWTRDCLEPAASSFRSSFAIRESECQSYL